ncbi:MAG: hypothetical protein ACK5DE_14335, partial [Bacteroidota bacterium]
LVTNYQSCFSKNKVSIIFDKSKNHAIPYYFKTKVIMHLVVPLLNAVQVLEQSIGMDSITRSKMVN